MTLYEQIQRERLTARIVEDIYTPPLAKTVMRVDLRGPNRIRGFKCAVRVQKPTHPIGMDAVLRLATVERQTKDRGT